MSTDEIGQTAADYARAARNAVEAGFDGVQILANYLYLLAQFLNRTTNRRTDELLINGKTCWLTVSRCGFLCCGFSYVLLIRLCCIGKAEAQFVRTNSPNQAAKRNNRFTKRTSPVVPPPIARQLKEYTRESRNNEEVTRELNMTLMKKHILIAATELGPVRGDLQGAAR